MRHFESLGQYHDLWGWLLLSAPDNFTSYTSEPIDQTDALKNAFNDLRSNFHLTKKNIKDERVFRIAQELLEMSYEAYLSGDTKTGAHALQECEGLIWKSRSSKIKYAVEAERRAFGENVTYAGVTISPYPYEGSKSDLGNDQAALLELAYKHCLSYLSKWKEFSFFAWVMDKEGKIQRISPDPKEDINSVLTPSQRTSTACWKKTKELGRADHIRACVFMSIIGAQGDGIVCFDLEQRGFPRISARQLFKLKKGPSHDFDDMRFHLEDPQVFQQPD
jgi:hypothetical protein